jgi:cobalt-zinc-cadmium efflux system outer membrane protein
MKRLTSQCCLALAITGMLGCASPRQAAFDVVDRDVEARTGHRVHWNQGSKEDDEVAARIHALLGAPLTADSAVEIALLNNPGLQATFEDLGVSQADLVQAGLLRNPSFGVSLLLPQSPGAVLDYGISLTQPLVELVLLPLRKRIAAMQLAQVQLHVTESVLRLAGETRTAYLRVQAAQEQKALQHAILEATEASGELSRRQLEAGNISELDSAAAQGALGQAQIDSTHAELELLAAREQLTRLLGLGGTPDWSITAKLAELPPQDALDDVESLAVAHRPDLEVARKETVALDYALSLARGTVWLGSLDVGVATERDAENLHVTGPTFQVELPLFDQHQAQIARLEALRRQSQRKVEDLTLAVRSEVRGIRTRLLSARSIATQYRTVVIPLRERLVRLAQQRYNGMLTGVFQLLLVRQEEVNAYRDYLTSVRDYWITRSDLALAIGGRLDGDRS